MAHGIIIKALSGFYYVSTDGNIITCRARGKHRYDNLTPLVGDYVQFTPTSDTEGALDSFTQRKNEFKRPAVANIDQLVLIVSEAIPKTDPFLIDRITSVAAKEHCHVVIVINKCDLATGDELYQIYHKAGFETLRTSATTGEGLDTLKALLKDKVSAFTGNSGVGKSSILNAVEPNMTLATGEISKKLGRGRHTTRHIELFPLTEGGYVADTPGFSSFEDDIMAPNYTQRLPETFLEFLPYLDHCKYSDCVHVKEQGCAVLQALEEGILVPTRHESYVRLYQQAKDISHWERTQYQAKHESLAKGKNKK